MSASEVFSRHGDPEWKKRLPRDEDIDFSDIPEQDFSGPDVVRGKYREIAFQTDGIVRLDPDLRGEFPDTKSVNEALRELLSKRPKKS